MLCPLSTIIKKLASADSTDREMSVSSTCLNDNAQTPLGLFVVDILYNQVCNKYTDKSNSLSLGLKPCIMSTIGLALLGLKFKIRGYQGAINSSLSSTTLLISINDVSWRFL